MGIFIIEIGIKIIPSFFNQLLLIGKSILVPSTYEATKNE